MIYSLRLLSQHCTAEGKNDSICNEGNEFSLSRIYAFILLDYYYCTPEDGFFLVLRGAMNRGFHHQPFRQQFLLVVQSFLLAATFPVHALRYSTISLWVGIVDAKKQMRCVENSLSVSLVMISKPTS